jgi:hypothetical protein
MIPSKKPTAENNTGLFQKYSRRDKSPFELFLAGNSSKPDHYSLDVPTPALYLIECVATETINSNGKQ